MECNAIHDGTHTKFTNTIVNMVTGLPGTNRNTFFPIGEIGAGEIC